MGCTKRGATAVQSVTSEGGMGKKIEDKDERAKAERPGAAAATTTEAKAEAATPMDTEAPKEKRKVSFEEPEAPKEPEAPPKTAEEIAAVNAAALAAFFSTYVKKQGITKRILPFNINRAVRCHIL